MKGVCLQTVQPEKIETIPRHLKCYFFHKTDCQTCNLSVYINIYKVARQTSSGQCGMIITLLGANEIA